VMISNQLGQLGITDCCRSGVTSHQGSGSP
jgi:hypothetical protein